MLGLICDVPLVQSFPGLAVESEDQSKFKVDAEILRDSGIPFKKKKHMPRSTQCMVYLPTFTIKINQM